MGFSQDEGLPPQNQLELADQEAKILGSIASYPFPE